MFSIRHRQTLHFSLHSFRTRVLLVFLVNSSSFSRNFIFFGDNHQKRCCARFFTEIMTSVQDSVATTPTAELRKRVRRRVVNGG